MSLSVSFAMLTKQEAFLIRLANSSKYDGLTDEYCECCGYKNMYQNVKTYTLGKVLCWNCYNYIGYGVGMIEICDRCEAIYA